MTWQQYTAKINRDFFGIDEEPVVDKLKNFYSNAGSVCKVPTRNTEKASNCCLKLSEYIYKFRK